MKVTPLADGDPARLLELVRSQPEALQRDRYRAVLLAMRGTGGEELEGNRIAAMLGRSPRFVDQWVGRYRTGGLSNLHARRQRGNKPALTPAQQEAFKARLLAGPTAKDGGVCTLRGRDAQRILDAEMGVPLKLSAVYDWMQPRRAFLPQAPAPAQEEQPRGDGGVRQDRPLFVQELRAAHRDQAVEVWFQDEARIGQQGTLTNVWALKNSRPDKVRQTEYEWVYLWAAVNPATGESLALLTPTVNSDYMSGYLKMLGEQVGPKRHAVLVLDNAGWHAAKALKIPANVTLLYLPPYSPELNPVERVWGYLRSHYLSNRVYEDYEELFDQAAAAWNKLDAARLASLTATSWCGRAI